MIAVLGGTGAAIALFLMFALGGVGVGVMVGCTLAGAMLLVKAMRWDRSNGRLRCPKCWYALPEALMAGLPVTCSECGKVVQKEAALRRSRPHAGLRLAAIALIVGGLVSPFVMMSSKQRYSLMPTSILLLFAQSSEEARSNFLGRSREPGFELPGWQREAAGEVLREYIQATGNVRSYAILVDCKRLIDQLLLHDRLRIVGMTARYAALAWGSVAPKVEYAFLRVIQEDWEQADQLLVQWENSNDPDKAFIAAWWKEHREAMLDHRAKEPR